jgi:hypothetical protein
MTTTDGQLELPLASALARSGDPETSHEAAASLSAAALRLSQEDVLFALRQLGGSATDTELLERYAELASREAVRWQSPSGLRTRRHELVVLGLVVDSGERRRLASGRRAVVWELAQ